MGSNVVGAVYYIGGRGREVFPSSIYSSGQKTGDLATEPTPKATTTSAAKEELRAGIVPSECDPFI